MAQITAADVSKLRTMTGVSMMECKKALVASGGDFDAAVKTLRELGVAVAAKRAEKAANQGLISSKISGDASKAVIVEVNCETDFVARNADFVKFVDKVAETALEGGNPAEVMKEEVSAQVSAIGEKIEIRRSQRFELQGSGLLASYIHMGGKVGVLLELGCEKQETVSKADFAEVAKDITLQIAASAPRWLDSSEVPADVVASEREIYANQMKDQNKPANIIEKIIDGKISKFYGENCLVDQVFVKDSELTICKLLDKVGKQVGDKLFIRRFVRYQLGA